MTRLEIVKSRGGESLAALSARTTNELDLPTTAVLNDVFINAVLREGQWIKIGRAVRYSPGEEADTSAEGEAPDPATS